MNGTTIDKLLRLPDATYPATVKSLHNEIMPGMTWNGARSVVALATRLGVLERTGKIYNLSPDYNEAMDRAAALRHGEMKRRRA